MATHKFSTRTDPALVEAARIKLGLSDESEASQVLREALVRIAGWRPAPTRMGRPPKIAA